MTVLWLDDVREPWAHGYVGATWAQSAAGAIDLLQSQRPDFASLDHDLADEHYPWNCKDIETCKGTGYDVVCWLEQNPEFWPPQGVAVHSMNPAGKQRMDAVIERHYGRTF